MQPCRPLRADLRTEPQRLHESLWAGLCVVHVALPLHRWRKELFEAGRGMTGFLDDAQYADDTQPEVHCAALLSRGHRMMFRRIQVNTSATSLNS